MEKAREEADFKKKMTERSTFSATTGAKKAKKQIKNGSEGYSTGSFNYAIDNSKYKTISGDKNIKAPPKKLKRVQTAKDRFLPLHFPKKVVVEEVPAQKPVIKSKKPKRKRILR